MRPVEALLSTYVEQHPEDAVRAFETVDQAEQARIFKALPAKISVGLLERMTAGAVAPLVGRLDAERAASLLQQASPRAASSVLHQLDDESRERILAAVEGPVAKSLRALAEYPEDTAGAIMEPRVMALSIDFNVRQACAAIRKARRDSLYYLYVTRRSGELIGVLNMRDLLLADPKDPIEPLVRRSVVTVPDTMDSEEVVALMRERGFLAVPVVDFDGRLVGVVKHSEALLAGQEAAFEDLQTLVGAGADERALSPVSVVVRSRLPWLLVNLATAFLASAIIGLFEGTITRVAALAVLLPVVAGQGGNTGSQALAVVMRGLALREVVPGVKRRLIAKELAGGLVNGVAVAAVTAVCVYGWRVAAGDATTAGVGLALVIGLAMIVNMAAAALAGAVIPLLLRALGRDPAQSSAIFLTTVTDIVGFASFLGFASLFMPMIG
ncbi:MAG: magnesium transporter [Planctomycetota bacterium]